MKATAALMQSILDPKWQLFIQVADTGSVSGAALALDMPQSVVSRQIARLEKESGARLFLRTGRGVQLTEFGQQVYPRIMALLREADQLALREDVLPALGLTVTDAANQLGVTRAALSRVINGRAAISPDMALRIEAWLGDENGGAARLWLAQQSVYDEWQARKAMKARPLRIKRVVVPA